MSWVIRVGRAGFEQSTNAGVITFIQGSFTSNTGRAIAQVKFSSNAGRTTFGKAGSNPACQAEQVWQSVLSTLVEVP